MSQANDDILDDGAVSVPRAAKILGVSPTTMHELLDKGRIPYETPSKHRRIRIAELARYQKSRTHRGQESRRREVVEDLLAE